MIACVVHAWFIKMIEIQAHFDSYLSAVSISATYCTTKPINTSNYSIACSPFLTRIHPSRPLTIQFMSKTHYLHSEIFYFNTASAHIRTREDPGSKLTESLTVFIFIITFELFGLSYFIRWICNIIMWHRENLQHVIRSFYFAKELKPKSGRRCVLYW